MSYQGVYWFRRLKKKNSKALARLLFTAWIEDADQAAYWMLQDLWPKADWDFVARALLKSEVPVRYDP